MKRIYLWPALLMIFAWQCWAIQISPDTIFTSTNTGTFNNSGDTGPQLIIKNANVVDTVFIDTMYFYRLSSNFFGGRITFNDTAHRCQYTIDASFINDSFFIAAGTEYYNCINSKYGNKIVIFPHDSVVLTNPILWFLATSVLGKEGGVLPYQCVLKVVFVPNIGTRDSAIFVGPEVSTGTKFKTIQSKMPVFSKEPGSPKLYDLSGRCIDKLSVRRHGVFIATYGQGNLVKKLMIGN
jgi:hypothetical protein